MNLLMTTTNLRNLISCRVKLTDEQRLALKNSYREQRALQLPVHSSVSRASTVSVSTNYGGKTELDRKLGLDANLVSDVLSSRDSLSLLAVLQLQQTLNVPIITKKDFLDSCLGYWDHVTSSVRS